MGMTLRGGPRAAAVRTVDVGVVAWIVLWFALGGVIGAKLHDLGRLATTVVRAGAAIEETSRALESLEDLPLVGPGIGRLSAEIAAAGRSAQASGREVRSDVDGLAALIGVSIALMPTVPILGLYVPLRIGRAREVRALKRAWRRHRNDATFLEFLARRAAHHLRFDELREVTDDPWRDINEGRFDALARAELQRLGIRDHAAGPSERAPA